MPHRPSGFPFGQMDFHGRTTRFFPLSISFTSYAKKKEMSFFAKNNVSPMGLYPFLLEISNKTLSKVIEK
jgi:hypothetical protein